MWLYIFISGQDTKKRLIRRAVYSFACLRLFLACQRRGCVVRTGFAAMHTLFFLNALAHTHPVYGFLSTLCLYFSYHSGHSRPYVGIVSHRKIDVYVRLPSATTAQAAAKRILSRRFVCTNAVPVRIICIFLCVNADSETKNTAQAH